MQKWTTSPQVLNPTQHVQNKKNNDIEGRVVSGVKHANLLPNTK